MMCPQRGEQRINLLVATAACCRLLNPLVSPHHHQSPRASIRQHWSTAVAGHSQRGDRVQSASVGLVVRTSTSTQGHSRALQSPRALPPLSVAQVGHKASTLSLAAHARSTIVWAEFIKTEF